MDSTFGHKPSPKLGALNMAMNYDEAKQLLRLHVGVIDDARREMILKDGFVTGLRPYTGLQEKNFHLVMEALFTVGDRIHEAVQVERDLIATIWSLCFYPRIWGLRSSGMLQRNKLISSYDTIRLESWVDAVEQTALALLDGQPLHQAVQHYAAYIVAARAWDNIAFFLPLMERAVSVSGQVAPTIILRALGKLGGAARSVLPALDEALKRVDSWSTTQFETSPANLDAIKIQQRAEVQKAIEAIEGSTDKV
jgi:hypothetical protein